MCEGATREEVLEEARCHIIHHGWFLQGILGEAGTEGGDWVYTVGLLENFGHPELVITDMTYEDGGRWLNQLGELVRDGCDLRDDHPASAGLLAVRDVHPEHFANDLVNVFIELEGRLPAAGGYLQVVPDAYCSCHRYQLTDLSDSNQFPTGRRRPNRSERRAAARRKRRDV